MNGASFDISITAKGVGVAATDAELAALANQIKQVDAVATSFDGAVAAASASLKNASAAASLAASSLGAAETKYGELERSANSAAKALEKATAAGKETTELAAAAAVAKAAMSAQAAVVDELRAKSESAAAAQKDLAATLGTLKTAQSSEAAAIKKRSAAQDQSTQGTELSIAAYITIARQIYRVARAVYDAAKAFTEFLLGTNPAAVAKLNNAYAKMTTNFRALFSGLKFDKLVDGLTNVMSIFDKGTSSARGLKTLVEYMFQPLIDGAAAAMPYIKAFLTGMIHGALLVVIAILKIRNAIFAAMSPETRAYIKKLVDNTFTLQNAFEAGKYVAIALAVALGALVLAMAAVLLVELLLVAPIIAIIEAIEHWGDITGWLGDQWTAFVKWLSGLWDKTVGKAINWGANLAASIIAGITGGLADGTSGAAGAMGKMVDVMNKTAKAKLDSHSPSRVYRKLFKTAPAGAVEGIEEGTADVHAAIDAMAAPPSGATASGGGAQAKGGPSSSITIQNLVVGSDPVSQDNLAKTKAMLVSLLTGASLTIGGGEVPA